MSAPEIEGFVFQRLLGSGGFADVYLYERQMPRSLVAVKVIRAEGLDAVSQARFTREANAMARLSTHPAIVPILGAAVTPRGEPYMVMAYYPKGSLAVRPRSERIPVPEVLRIGILISGAVETAHRAGILHRDIKPANILIGEFGNPGLADFGIATTTADLADSGDELSLPWAPPEALAGSGVDASSDVYSLAATLYSLLTSRSPFEVPGDSNTSAELMHRIEHLKLPPTGRNDVPPALERLISQAMAKRQDLRSASALSFARALQDIERELRLAQTEIVIPDDADAGDSLATDGEHTVQRPVSPWVPEPGRLAGGAPRGGGRLTTPSSVLDASPGTVKRPSAAGTDNIDATDGGEAPPASTSRRAALVGVVVIVVLAAVVGISLALGHSPKGKGAGSHSVSTMTTTIETNPNPPAPTKLRVVRSGSTIRVSWSDRQPAPGDHYSVELVTSPNASLPLTITNSRAASMKRLTKRKPSARLVSVTASKGVASLCARVKLFRSSGNPSAYSPWRCG